MVPDTFKSTCGFQAIIVLQCVFEGALTLPGNLTSFYLLLKPCLFRRSPCASKWHCRALWYNLIDHKCRPLSKCKQASKETDLYLYKNLVAWGRFVQMEFKKQHMHLASINAYTCVRAWTASHFIQPCHFTSFASLIPDAPSSRHHARHCAEQSLQTHRCPVTSGLSEMNLQFILVSHVSLLIRKNLEEISVEIYSRSKVFSGEASTEFLPVLVAVLPPVCPCLGRAGCAGLICCYFAKNMGSPIHKMYILYIIFYIKYYISNIIYQILYIIYYIYKYMLYIYYI